MNKPDSFNRHILLVDDNVAIHEDFLRVLVPKDETSTIDNEAEALFGDSHHVRSAPLPTYNLEFARQGEQALVMVADAIAKNTPFALAFVDMRMPPGWDGLTTIVKLWEADPRIQIVICTAYSDRSWHEIQTTLTAREHWLILKKPFDKVEVLQLAQSLTDKWNLTRIAEARQAQLEALVQERTDQLRVAMQIKNEFLANMSHELQTPLNGVMGMLEIVKHSPLSQEQSDFVEQAYTCADSLATLIQQILTFNQAEAGTLSLESNYFDLAELLAHIEKIYRARATHKGLRLQAIAAGEVPQKIYAPERLIRDVLQLLVDNSVKFTRQGVITIRASVKDRHLTFRVVDTGIGMSPEHLKIVSHPFGQVDGGLTRKSAGTGIGLTLSKRIVESLGGELEMTSELGVGTTVHFTALATASAPRQAIAV